MKRTLIKQGAGGYTIYLPKKWLGKKGLKEGQQIDVIETETGLIIESAVSEKKETKLEVTDENKADMYPILTHLYRRGFDTIILTGKFEEVFSEIKHIAKNLLLGFEITEIEKEHCKISNISEPSEQKYDVLLRRVFLIIKETLNIVADDFNANKFERMSEIEELKHQQDKYILFCRRILIKEKNVKTPTIEWELLTFLMHINHALYYTYKYAKENKLQKSARITELLENLHSCYDLYYNAFFKKDIKLVHKINKLKKEYQFGKCYEYLKQSRDGETVILSHLREIFRLIQIGASPILSGLIQEEMR